MAADDGPRETFLRDAKYERLYRSIGYRDVNRTVRRFLSSPIRSKAILLDGKEDLERRKAGSDDPKERANIDLQIAALNAFETSINMLPIAGVEFEAVGNRVQSMYIEGVAISIYPTVWVRQRRSRGRDQLGALIIDPAMGTPLKTPEAASKDRRAKDVACSLLHLHVSSTRCTDSDVASHEHCTIFHVHRRDLFTAPTGYKRDLKNMERDVDRELITVGWHKGEVDFRVSGMAADLTFEQMQQLRAMIPVAIAQLENMFMRGVQERNPAAQEKSQS